MDFLPTTEAGLNAYIANRLEPQRAEPAWLTAYDDAYARAEEIWPTLHAHREREIFATLAADMHVAAARAQPEPAAVMPQPDQRPAEAKPATQKKKLSFADVRAKQHRETAAAMDRIRRMPGTTSALSVQGCLPPSNEASKDAIAAGWEKAFGIGVDQ